MNGRLLIIQNASWAGLGSFEPVLQARAVPTDVVNLELGNRIPAVEDYGAVVLFGGTASANDDTEEMRHQQQRLADCLATGVPVLGVCLGLQVLVKVAGGEARAAAEMEVGLSDPRGEPYTIELTAAGLRDPLLTGLPRGLRVFQSHGDEVIVGPGMEPLATASQGTRNQIVRVGDRAYGLQMHIEMTRDVLTTWTEVDPHLAQLDIPALEAELASVEPGMSAHAQRIFGNFLTIAGL